MVAEQSEIRSYLSVTKIKSLCCNGVDRISHSPKWFIAEIFVFELHFPYFKSNLLQNVCTLKWFAPHCHALSPSYTC